MSTIEQSTRLVSLDRVTCLELLRNDVIGRLAVVEGGAPSVVPVNYALDGDVIVFRSGPGTKLSAVERAPACLEIDSFDRHERLGWSVVVTGRLEEVTAFEPGLLARVRGMPVDPWAGGERSHWLRLVPTRITGRRIVRG